MFLFNFIYFIFEKPKFENKTLQKPVTHKADWQFHCKSLAFLYSLEPKTVNTNLHEYDGQDMKRSRVGDGA